jgi:hypothetical protein
MIERTDRHRGAGPAFGVVLIILGSVFLLEELGFMVVGHLIDTWWPMLLVILGISKMAWQRTVSAGGWLVFVGLWLQAIQLSLFGLTFSNSWPVFLIVAGAVMIVQSLRGSRGPESAAHRNGGRP